MIKFWNKQDWIGKGMLVLGVVMYVVLFVTVINY